MKNIVKFFLIFLFLVSFNIPATQAKEAAIFEFSENSRNVFSGEEFTINIFVNPRGENLDTARVSLNYDSEKLDVNFISLGDLFPNISPNSFYEKNLIYYGGYKLGGGIKEYGKFITIGFRAKGIGQTSLIFNNDSKLISNGEEKINFSGLKKLSLNILPSPEAKEVAEKIIIQSPTNPEQEKWSNNNNVELNWNLLPDIEKYSYAVDNQIPNTQPWVEINQDNFIALKDVSDGVWFFYLKAELKDGEKIEPVYYQLKIDTSAPEPIMPISEQRIISEGEEVKFFFQTADDVSGIDFYEVNLNNEGWERKDSPLILKGLEIGEYKIKVRAIDLAGNVSEGEEKVLVFKSEDIIKGKIGKTQCSDGIDNDDDGLIDYPEDPDCKNVYDNNEKFVSTPLTVESVLDKSTRLIKIIVLKTKVFFSNFYNLFLKLKIIDYLPIFKEKVIDFGIWLMAYIK